MPKQPADQPDDKAKKNEAKKGKSSECGAPYDPLAAPDNAAESTAPRSIPIGSPLSEDQFRELKRRAASDRPQRTIQPQEDRGDEDDHSTNSSEDD